jgi:hypothetical protein
VLARSRKKRERGRKETGQEGAEREREGGSLPTGRQRPVGSGPRPAGTGGMVRPCRATNSTGKREGADRQARTHGAGWLRQLTGRPERAVLGSRVG